MTDRAKFEQMLEFLINEDKAKAEELFHELVVAKSREIYENLLDDDIQVDEEKDEDEDEEVEEGFDLESDVAEVGGDPADDMMADMEAGDEEGDEDSMDAEEGGDEPATKDDVMDIKDALEDLKAEFEAMLAGEKEEEPEMGGEEGEDDEEMKDAVQFEASDDEDEDEEVEEGMVREYVEKVAAARMGDDGANTKSIVAGKNDMGGTAANIAKGGESTKGGTQGGLANPSPKDIATGNVNVPGGKAGVKHLSNVKSPKGGDDGANKKSTLGA